MIVSAHFYSSLLPEREDKLPCEKDWADLTKVEQTAVLVLGWNNEEVCSHCTKQRQGADSLKQKRFC